MRRGASLARKPEVVPPASPPTPIRPRLRAIRLDAGALPPARPWYTDVWLRMLRRKPLGTLGGVIVLVMLLAAAFADVLTPYGFAQTSLRERFITMSADHWLGTDQLGRDVATRILYGARISLYVGFGAVVLGSLLATALGIFSAYRGGGVDLLVQRAVDAWMAFPPLLILMSILSLLGPSVLNITLVLGIAFGIQNSRVVRGVALGIREQTYVEGARALGSGHVRIAFGHILPNVLPTIIVVATTGLSTVILTEASLSFLGLGVPPPHPTWGGMLSLAGLDHMYRAPWLALWPATALSLAVFGFNMLGDALRDLLDPRMRGS
jgi:peptide/nickel transport system permease protein